MSFSFAFLQASIVAKSMMMRTDTPEAPCYNAGPLHHEYVASVKGLSLVQ